MTLTLLILASCTFLVITEILKRKFALPTSLTRRAAHIGTAGVAAVAPLFVTQMEIVVVSIVFATVLLLGRRSKIFSAIHSVERATFGEVYLPLGVALSALLFLPHDTLAFQFGILVMGISDALAGFLGERFGKHFVYFFNNKKSVEGSVVFFVSTVFISLFFIPGLEYRIVVIPLLLTLSEFLLVYGLDNLMLPVIAGLLIQLF